jgi:hypothetical protein
VEWHTVINQAIGRDSPLPHFTHLSPTSPPPLPLTTLHDFSRHPTTSPDCFHPNSLIIVFCFHVSLAVLLGWVTSRCRRTPTPSTTTTPPWSLSGASSWTRRTTPSGSASTTSTTRYDIEGANAWVVGGEGYTWSSSGANCAAFYSRHLADVTPLSSLLLLPCVPPCSCPLPSCAATRSVASSSARMRSAGECSGSGTHTSPSPLPLPLPRSLSLPRCCCPGKCIIRATVDFVHACARACVCLQVRLRHHDRVR